MEIEVGKIYAFRSHTGEEIVGRVTGIFADRLTLNSPLGIAMLQDKGMQFVPLMFSTDLDGEYIFYTSDLRYVSTVREDVENSYIESTSGLQIPASKQIITG